MKRIVLIDFNSTHEFHLIDCSKATFVSKVILIELTHASVRS
jgi:hypothetical protein